MRANLSSVTMAKNSRRTENVPGNDGPAFEGTLRAQIILAIASVVPLLSLPILVGTLVDHWGYTASTAGYVSSSDLAGLCLGSLLTSSIARRVHSRHYVICAITLCIVANLCCALSHALWPMLLFRLTAGIAAGAIYATCLMLLSRRRDAARGFSTFIFASVIANATILAIFPTLTTAWGPAALFIAIASILAVSFVVLGAIPPTPLLPDSQEEGSVPHSAMQVPTALCLLAVALFYLAIGSYWSYAERMGLDFGLSANTVHRHLSLGVLLSALGCLLAFWLTRRIDQSRPLLIALLVLAATLLLHVVLPIPAMFIVTLNILQLCWNFVDIFQLGTLSIVDPTGRGAGLVPAAQGAALALGPAAGAAILASGNDYRGVLAFAGSATALAAILYGVVHWVYRLDGKGRTLHTV